MLSYRHAFHAGNFADVLKHSVLTLVLEYMVRKDKGFTYVDSHSGAGMYSLNEEYAQKTGEYKDGIAKILAVSNDDDFPEALMPYVELLQKLNAENSELEIYPGSPGIAKQFKPCRPLQFGSSHCIEKLDVCILGGVVRL